MALRGLVALSCLTAVWFRSAAASAQPTEAGAPVAESETAARAAFESGVAAFEAQRYEAARAAFRRALSLKPSSSSIRRNLGIAEVYAGRYARGAQRLTRFLRAEQDLDSTAQARIAQTLALATQHLERVSLVCREPGVAVYVDGELVGQTPIAGAWYVAPGPYVVSAEKLGFLPLTERHTAGAGQARTLVLEMASRGVPRAAEEAATPSPLFAQEQRSNTPAYLLFAASGAGLAAGTLSLLRGSALQRDANAEFTRSCAGSTDLGACSEASALDRRAAQMRTAALVGFAASGAALLGGVLLYSSETAANGGLRGGQRLEWWASANELGLALVY